MRKSGCELTETEGLLKPHCGAASLRRCLPLGNRGAQHGPSRRPRGTALAQGPGRSELADSAHSSRRPGPGPNKRVRIRPDANEVLVQCDLLIVSLGLATAGSAGSEPWLALPWNAIQTEARLLPSVYSEDRPETPSSRRSAWRAQRLLGPPRPLRGVAGLIRRCLGIWKIAQQQFCLCLFFF